MKRRAKEERKKVLDDAVAKWKSCCGKNTAIKNNVIHPEELQDTETPFTV